MQQHPAFNPQHAQMLLARGLLNGTPNRGVVGPLSAGAMFRPGAHNLLPDHHGNLPPGRMRGPGMGTVIRQPSPRLPSYQPPLPTPQLNGMSLSSATTSTSSPAPSSSSRPARPQDTIQRIPHIAAQASTLSEATLGRIDSASVSGKFGWTTIDSVEIPFLLREEKKYLAVRMVEMKLLSKYPSTYPDELKKRPPLMSHYITEYEARLLNEINIHHCNGEFGTQPFTTQHLIVKMTDFEEFYNIVKKHFPSSSLNQSGGKQEKAVEGGWIQLNNTVVPFVFRGKVKYVPLSVIRYAAGLLTDVRVEGDPLKEDEWNYLNESCRGAGVEFTFSKTAKLVRLEEVQRRCNNTVSVNDLPKDDPFSQAQYQGAAEEEETPASNSMSLSTNQMPYQTNTGTSRGPVNGPSPPSAGQPPAPQGVPYWMNHHLGIYPSAGPGHGGPGHPGPGHAGPGHGGPGHAGPGHAYPGSSPHLLRGNVRPPLVSSSPHTPPSGIRTSHISPPTTKPTSSAAEVNNNYSHVRRPSHEAAVDLTRELASPRDRKDMGSSGGNSVAPGALNRSLSSSSLSQNTAPAPRTSSAGSAMHRATPDGSPTMIPGGGGGAGIIPGLHPAVHIDNLPMMTSIVPPGHPGWHPMMANPAEYHKMVQIMQLQAMAQQHQHQQQQLQQQLQLLEQQHLQQQRFKQHEAVAKATRGPTPNKDIPRSSTIQYFPQSRSLSTNNTTQKSPSPSVHHSQAPAAAPKVQSTPPPPPPPPTKPSLNQAVIQRVEFQGKTLSCIVKGEEKEHYALVEALSRVYFPNCTLEEFQFALEKVLQVPLVQLSQEEERSFISFYNIPTKTLMCNKVIRLADFQDHIPKLRYMFKDKLPANLAEKVPDPGAPRGTVLFENKTEGTKSSTTHTSSINTEALGKKVSAALKAVIGKRPASNDGESNESESPGPAKQARASLEEAVNRLKQFQAEQKSKRKSSRPERMVSSQSPTSDTPTEYEARSPEPEKPDNTENKKSDNESQQPLVITPSETERTEEEMETDTDVTSNLQISEVHSLSAVTEQAVTVPAVTVSQADNESQAVTEQAFTVNPTDTDSQAVTDTLNHVTDAVSALTDTVNAVSELNTDTVSNVTDSVNTASDVVKASPEVINITPSVCDAEDVTASSLLDSTVTEGTGSDSVNLNDANICVQNNLTETPTESTENLENPLNKAEEIGNQETVLEADAQPVDFSCKSSDDAAEQKVTQSMDSEVPGDEKTDEMGVEVSGEGELGQVSQPATAQDDLLFPGTSITHSQDTPTSGLEEKSVEKDEEKEKTDDTNQSSTDLTTDKIDLELEEKAQDEKGEGEDLVLEGLECRSDKNEEIETNVPQAIDTEEKAVKITEELPEKGDETEQENDTNSGHDFEGKTQIDSGIIDETDEQISIQPVSETHMAPATSIGSDSEPIVVQEDQTTMENKIQSDLQVGETSSNLGNDSCVNETVSEDSLPVAHLPVISPSETEGASAQEVGPLPEDVPGEQEVVYEQEKEKGVEVPPPLSLPTTSQPQTCIPDSECLKERELTSTQSEFLPPPPPFEEMEVDLCVSKDATTSESIDSQVCDASPEEGEEEKMESQNNCQNIDNQEIDGQRLEDNFTIPAQVGGVSIDGSKDAESVPEIDQSEDGAVSGSTSIKTAESSCETEEGTGMREEDMEVCGEDQIGQSLISGASSDVTPHVTENELMTDTLPDSGALTIDSAAVTTDSTDVISDTMVNTDSDSRSETVNISDSGVTSEDAVTVPPTDSTIESHSESAVTTGDPTDSERNVVTDSTAVSLTGPSSPVTEPTDLSTVTSTDIHLDREIPAPIPTDSSFQAVTSTDSESPSATSFDSSLPAVKSTDSSHTAVTLTDSENLAVTTTESEIQAVTATDSPVMTTTAVSEADDSDAVLTEAPTPSVTSLKPLSPELDSTEESHDDVAVTSPPSTNERYEETAATPPASSDRIIIARPYRSVTTPTDTTSDTTTNPTDTTTDETDMTTKDSDETTSLTFTTTSVAVTTTSQDDTTTTSVANIETTTLPNIETSDPALPLYPTSGLPSPTPPTQAQPTQDLPTQSPPTQAPPTQAQPTQAQPTEDLPTESFPTEALPSQAQPIPALPNQDLPTEAPPSQDQTTEALSTQTPPTQTLPSPAPAPSTQPTSPLPIPAPLSPSPPSEPMIDLTLEPSPEKSAPVRAPRAIIGLFPGLDDDEEDESFSELEMKSGVDIEQEDKLLSNDKVDLEIDGENGSKVSVGGENNELEFKNEDVMEKEEEEVVTPVSDVIPGSDVRAEDVEAGSDVLSPSQVNTSAFNTEQEVAMEIEENVTQPPEISEGMDIEETERKVETEGTGETTEAPVPVSLYSHNMVNKDDMVVTTSTSGSVEIDGGKEGPSTLHETVGETDGGTETVGGTEMGAETEKGGTETGRADIVSGETGNNETEKTGTETGEGTEGQEGETNLMSPPPTNPVSENIEDENGDSNLSSTKELSKINESEHHTASSQNTPSQITDSITTEGESQEISSEKPGNAQKVEEDLATSREGENQEDMNQSPSDSNHDLVKN